MDICPVFNVVIQLVRSNDVTYLLSLSSKSFRQRFFRTYPMKYIPKSKEISLFILYQNIAVYKIGEPKVILTKNGFDETDGFICFTLDVYNTDVTDSSVCFYIKLVFRRVWEDIFATSLTMGANFS